MAIYLLNSFTTLYNIIIYRIVSQKQKSGAIGSRYLSVHPVRIQNLPWRVYYMFIITSFNYHLNRLIVQYYNSLKFRLKIRIMYNNVSLYIIYSWFKIKKK